jgi:hypothetical protein
VLVIATLHQGGFETRPYMSLDPSAILKVATALIFGIPKSVEK